MAIRIRKVKSEISKSGYTYVALCAAETKVCQGDIYLDDGMHTALTTKFREDFTSEGLISPPSEITEGAYNCLDCNTDCIYIKTINGNHNGDDVDIDIYYCPECKREWGD